MNLASALLNYNHGPRRGPSGEMYYYSCEYSTIYFDEGDDTIAVKVEVTPSMEIVKCYTHNNELMLVASGQEVIEVHHFFELVCLALETELRLDSMN